MNPSRKQKQTHTGKRLVVAKGEGGGKGRDGHLGSVDANYGIEKDRQ